MTGDSRAWHVAIHARPDGVAEGPSIEYGEMSLPTLLVPPDAQAALLPVSFEAAAACLHEFEHCSVEPDGALLWVAPPESARRWQLDGQLWDRQGHLWALEVYGRCPQQEWDRLLTVLGWPDQRLMVRLVREAVFVEERAFRQFAFRP